MSDAQGLPLTDLVEGAEFKPEVSGDVAELEALLSGVEPVAATPEATPETETPAPAEPEWRHGPTGKVFDSELELLRYESGAKSNEIGELRAAVEMVDKLAAQAPEQGAGPPPSQEQMEKNLLKLAFPNVPDEQLSDPAYKQIAKGMENLIGAYDGIVEKRLAGMQSAMDAMQSATAERTAISDSGMDRQTIKDTLEKHPGLKALPIKDQVAVIRAIAEKGAGDEPANPLRSALQPDAAGHVEGSVGSPPPDSKDIDSAFFKLGDSERLAALGKMFEESEVGQHIKDAHL